MRPVSGRTRERYMSVTGQNDLILRCRLMNCLETLLELEPALRRLSRENFLAEEFSVIKSFIEAMEELELDEAEVKRIEGATKIFLEELGGPLKLIVAKPKSGRLVQ